MHRLGNLSYRNDSTSSCPTYIYHLNPQTLIISRILRAFHNKQGTNTDRSILQSLFLLEVANLAHIWGVTILNPTSSLQGRGIFILKEDRIYPFIPEDDSWLGPHAKSTFLACPFRRATPGFLIGTRRAKEGLVGGRILGFN